MTTITFVRGAARFWAMVIEPWLFTGLLGGEYILTAKAQIALQKLSRVGEP